MSLRFHWMLPKGREVVINSHQTPKAAARYRLEATNNSSPAPKPDMKGWCHFATKAEEAGIDSILISFSRYEPESMVVASALGSVTQKLRFIVAFRAGLMQPAFLVQQTNTVSGVINGRLSLNIVAGSSKEEQRGYGDFLNHDDRYVRAEEFLTICNALWRDNCPVTFAGKYYQIENGQISTPFQAPDREIPEMFVSGHSLPSQQLAISQGSCWLRVVDTSEKLAPMVSHMRQQGVEVCLRNQIICRSTREEALRVIDEILEYSYEAEKKLNRPDRSDSQMFREAAAAPKGTWLNDTIWAGFTPFHGPVWTTLVGTPDQLAKAFLDYERIGVRQFIMSGWPEVDEVTIFGQEVLPRIRALSK